MAASEKLLNANSTEVVSVNGQKVTSASTGTGKKRGRKPLTVDAKKRVEQSRQSARECRARKKLRYQYVEELVASREKAIYSLRSELNMLKQWCLSIDQGVIPAEYVPYMIRLKLQISGSSSDTASEDLQFKDIRTDLATCSNGASFATIDESIIEQIIVTSELPDLGNLDRFLNQ